MICKWCGAAVTAGGNKCSRCGREIPAMSDCGGFYDLVPNPGGVAVPVAVPAAPVAPPAPSPEELARRAAAKKKAEQMALIRLGVFAGVALIIVIMLIVVLVRISGIEQRLGTAEQNVENLDSNLSAHLEDRKAPEKPNPDNDNPESTKPTNPTQPTTQPTEPTVPDVDTPTEPDPEPDVPDSWSFQIKELEDNGRSFVSGMANDSAIELTLNRDVAWMEDGVCFVDSSAEENPGQILIIPAEQNLLTIRFTGSLVQNYLEFCDTVTNNAGKTETVIAAWDNDDVTVKNCCLNEERDAAIYTVEVTEEIYLFFTEAMENAEMVCAYKLEKVNGDQTIYVTFQPEVPEDEGTPETPTTNDGLDATNPN